MENKTKNQSGYRMLLICLLFIACILCGCKEDSKQTVAPTGEAETTPGEVSLTPAETKTDEEEPTRSEEGQAIYQFQLPKEGDTCAEFVISGYGSIFVKLFPEDCPLAVENFIGLAEEGYYDNMKVDRALEGYLFQSGNPEEDGGESIYGGGFENEFSEKLLPARGALCMANRGEDGTNMSQFFFVATDAKTVAGIEAPLDNRYHMSVLDYLKEAYETEITEQQWDFFKVYGGAPWLAGQNTVFGQVYEGFSVMDKVCNAKVTSKLKPNPLIYITTVRIFTFE